MSFKGNVASDVEKVILNKDEFAEDVVYTPKGGSPKTIRAIIVRGRLDSGAEDSGRTLRKQCEVHIANNVLTGVTLVNKGSDTLQFSEVIGGSNVTWVVLDILRQDFAMWHLLVGK